MKIKHKNIHVVFGRTKKILIDSEVFDLKSIHLACLDDNLSVGPVCDLYSIEDTQKRKDWLRSTFGYMSYSDKIINAVEKDIETVKTIIENSEKFDKIFLWTGYNSSEIISTARLLYHLSKINKSIFIVNYPNIPVKSIHGKIIYPKALGQTAIFQVKEIAKHFELIEEKELWKWETLWGKVISENALLRVIDKDGRIHQKDVAYFDTFLESNCNNKFQKSAWVVAHTLIDIDFGVNDNYLNWRLKQLSLQGKIETQGKLKDLRDYEVKRITTDNTL